MWETKFWVTCAGSEEEAWKAILLARSLKRAITIHPLAVIVSSNLSEKVRIRLASEFHLCDVVPSPVVKEYGEGPFTSFSKPYMLGQEKFRRGVFLDPSCVLLKNCDFLFQEGGGVEKIGAYSVIVVPPRCTTEDELKEFVKVIVDGPNSLAEVERGIQLLQCCMAVDMGSPHPLAAPGKDVSVTFFANGHPVCQWLKKGERWNPQCEVGKSLAAYIEILLKEMDLKIEKPLTSTYPLNDCIAIVGMSCRYAGANSIDEFWNLLEKGLEGVVRVPEWRWTKEHTVYGEDETRQTQAGFLACPVDSFDPQFFATNAVELQYLDPQQRLCLRLVWEALEHSCIDPLSLKGSLTGVFGGWWRNDYKECVQMGKFDSMDFLRLYMGTALGPLTARIAHFYELIGPAFSTESGCSTSIAGIDMALDCLRGEKCNLAVCVGANLLLHPFDPRTAMTEGVLAPDGRSKVFDASADGFGRAEGVGVLILKRYGDAIADGDKIWGLLRGSAVVQEGTSKSMGTPTMDVEAKAMKLALERSGVHPDDVEFLEMHGTGTPVGDPIEVGAVARAYSVRGGRKKPLIIGSVKTNVGHTESVCGITGIQKVVLSMHYDLIPKHLNLTTLSPTIDLTKIPAQIPLEPIPWKRRKFGPSRFAGVNSFGITGAQASIIVQEPPAILPKPSLCGLRDQRDRLLLTFSAKAEESLKAQMQAYVNLLEQEEHHSSLLDIEYTLHTGRAHLPFRQLVCGTGKAELLNQLREVIKEGAHSKTIKVPKVCFLFTGQGSQYQGMAKELYDQSIMFRTTYDWCDSILEKEYGIRGIKDVLKTTEDAQKLLENTLYSQVSIFVIEYCLLRLWQSWGIQPTAVVGHSLGEFAAYIACGMISPEDAIKLVVTRTKLINNLPKGSMLVMNKNEKEVLELIAKAIPNGHEKPDIAAVNSEAQTVIAGTSSGVNIIKGYCENNGVKAQLLRSSHAFHSKMMEPMLKAYEKVAETINFQPARKDCAFISSVKGKELSCITPKYLLDHTREKVEFVAASQVLVNNDYTVFLEVGPHPVLSAFIHFNNDSGNDIHCLPSLRRKTPGSWETILDSLGKMYKLGVPINWKGFHRYSGGKKVVDLPGYIFQETSCWIEKRMDISTPFHPLVGAEIPNPSDTFIYRNLLNLTKQPWIKDHMIGNKVIFPACGFLEMCLTASYTASQGTYSKPGGALGLHDFNIAIPLALEEGQVTEMQTVVNKGGDGSMTASVYNRIWLDDGTSKWIKNASATFVPALSDPTSSLPPELLNFTELRERISTGIESKMDYSQYPSHTFQFGPTCQTLTAAWGYPASAPKEYLWKFQLKQTAEEVQKYIVHPWIIDPMLQTIGLGLANSKNIPYTKQPLVVPVSMEKYYWWGGNPLSGYTYVILKEDKHDVHLYDAEGNIVASMLGCEFLETTLANIMALIGGHRNLYPSMAEVVWKEQLGPNARRLPNEVLENLAIHDLFRDIQKEHNMVEMEPGNYLIEHYGSEKSDTLTPYQELVKLHLLISIKMFGVSIDWETLQVDGIGENVKMRPQFKSLFEAVVQEMSKNLSISDLLPKMTRPLAEIERQKETLLSSHGNMDLMKFDAALQKLPDIIRGAKQPETDFVEWFLKQSNFISLHEKMFANLQASTIHRMLQGHERKQGTGKPPILRLLEISRFNMPSYELLGKLTSLGIPFHCTFACGTQAVLDNAKEVLKNMDISTNIDTMLIDPTVLITQQSILPSHFDILILPEVLSDGYDLQDLCCALKPSGLIFYRHIDNLLSSFLSLYMAGFAGSRQLPTKAEAGFKETEQAIVSSGGGIHLVVAKARSKEMNSVNWIVVAHERDAFLTNVVQRLQNRTNCKIKLLLIKDLEEMGKDNLETNIQLKLKEALEQSKVGLQGIIYLSSVRETVDCQSSCEPFLYLCKYLVAVSNAIKVVLVTRGQMCTGESDYEINTPETSPLVTMLSVLGNENQDITCKCIDVTNDFESVIDELFIQDEEMTIAYRNHQRYTPRLKMVRKKKTELSIPDTPKFRLIMPPSHQIQDLSFAPYEPEHAAFGHVEIKVRCYALNFLDVLMVTKPDPIFENYNYLGLDLAGVVSALGPGCKKLKLGDRVMTTRNHGPAMPTHIFGDESHAILMPDDMTFSEACFYPLAATTVLRSLRTIAKVRSDDVLLVHAASGGVGIAAIHLAKQAGCTVIATAGNQRKRNFLQDLGADFVFNSRSTKYADEILRVLGGPKVTVVLNSLTGPGFKEATLSVCAAKARFMEISKMNVWSKEEVAAFRPDVFYEVVDVSLLSNEEWLIYHEMMQNEIAQPIAERGGIYSSMAMTQFACTEIREALEYMERVKHIGKIVINMPDRIGKDGPRFNLFNTSCSYLISGGMGGVGFEVAKWMVSEGAETIFLLGRNRPNEFVQKQIEIMKKSSPQLRIIPKQCDVGNVNEVSGFFRETERQGYPPVKGIIHAAGVLDDAMYENQSWDKYEKVYKSKVKGGWNLHKVSTQLKHSMEHFVVFSSVTSTFGAAGQSNYASANYYLDQLIHYRNSRGLPGLTINWGQWAQVGMAADLQHNLFKPFSIKQGLAALEYAMRNRSTQLVAYEADLKAIRDILPSTRGLLADIEFQTGEKAGSGMTENEFWSKYDEQEDYEHRYKIVKNIFHKTVARVLRLGPNEVIDENENLETLGVDSLSFVELKNELQATLGRKVKIGMNQVKDCRTIHQFSAKLVEIISGKEDMKPLPIGDLIQLLKKDWTLPEGVQGNTDALRKLTPNKDISTVFVVGGTGLLGSYVFMNLWNNPKIHKIYCLVRQTPLATIQDRFLRTLEVKNVITTRGEFLDNERLELVVGDIAKPMLGMEEAAYHSLCQEVDTIFNFAGTHGAVDAYRDIKEDKGSNRLIHVLGFKNVLQFAVESKLKHLVQPSTWEIAAHLTKDGHIPKETSWPNVPSEDQMRLIPNTGYHVSKIVQEGLVVTAKQLGVPIKLVRLPHITGELGTGKGAQLEGPFMQRVYGYMSLGLMPKRCLPLNSLPVDYCSKILMDLCLHPADDETEVYNILNPNFGDESHFFHLFEEIGINVKSVETEVFLEELNSKLKDNNDETVQLLGAIKSCDVHRGNMEEGGHPLIRAWQSGKSLPLGRGNTGYEGIMGKVPSSMENIKADLLYAKKSGMFDRYRITYA